MHEHDMDLIMALAEDRLGDADAKAAERRLSSCDQCLADLSLQRSAFDELRAAPRVYLTATESATLRSQVRGELRLAASETTTAKRPRRLALGALAGAAAVLMAVVVAGPALDLLGARDGESVSTDDVALSPLAPDLEPGEERALTQTEDDASRVSDEPVPPAVAESPVLEMAGAASELPTLPPDTDLAVLKASIIEQGGSIPVVEAAPELPQPEPSPPTDVMADQPFQAAGACDPASVPGAPADAEAVTVGNIEYDGNEALVIAYITEPLEDTKLFVLDLATCTVLVEV